MERRVTEALAALVCLAPALAARPGQPTAQAPTHHARPRLIAQASSASPGKTVNLGVSFEVEPGWHLYWNGRNDSGFPVSIALSLPEGYAADKALWPAPARHLMPGDILDHVYEGRVTLVIPVHVPAGAPLGAAAEFSAHLEWMECSTLCLLADGDVSLSLPVTAGGPPSPDAPLFAEAFSRIPAPLPEHPKDVALSWDKGVLRIASEGAEYLAFFPANEGPALVDPAAEGESREGALTLRFRWPEGVGSPDMHVHGVVEVHRPGIPPAFYTLDLTQGQTGGAPQPPTTPSGIR
jgi:thiol:disulfide interchange protein DsbD